MMLTMVKCSIQTHILEILQKSASLIGIIQTYISNLWYSNLNNILIWSKQSINWCGDLIWVPKHYIKISNGYDKGRIYIVYKCLHLSHSSIQCYLNIEVFHTYQLVRTHMHVKFEHNLVLTLILQNTMLYKVMVVENKGFFYTAFRGKKIRHRNWIYEIECVIKNVIDERRVILEKFRKNNHQIWIKYDGEIPVTNFNSRLKG